MPKLIPLVLLWVLLSSLHGCKRYPPPYLDGSESDVTVVEYIDRNHRGRLTDHYQVTRGPQTFDVVFFDADPAVGGNVVLTVTINRRFGDFVVRDAEGRETYREGSMFTPEQRAAVEAQD